ncbi:MAG: hypothetical protein HY940_06800 [Gammaproteobacteria bacterium]|nr:hypothetical protein [Gammaproteobacteria bacterium]
MNYLVVMLTLLLGACAPAGGPQVPPQQWGDIQIVVETRPAPLQVGMNEFLVLATRPHRMPAYDLVVEMRLADDQPWGQGIQDGNTGVYRKALAVRDHGPQHLQVALRNRHDSALQQRLQFEFPAAVNP